MKTFVNTLLIILGLAFTYPANSSALIDDNTKKPIVASFQAAILPTPAFNAIHVFVEKPVGKTVAIRIMSESGVELACQYVQKRVDKYRMKFNLESLVDGKYKVVISDGQTTSEYPFTMSTQAPVVTPRSIVLS